MVIDLRASEDYNKCVEDQFTNKVLDGVISK